MHENRSKGCRRTQHVAFAVALLATVFTGIPAAYTQDEDPMSAAGRNNVDPDDLKVVDCLLPGQVRKLGGMMTYLTPQRPAKTSAVDCEIRGGEYTAWDRATYESSLKVWLPQAETGDPQAQTYVGEIYEKRLDPPDYAEAAKWYSMAAEQGNRRAQRHLAYLYERGLGVEADPLTALSWYRQASGITDDDLVFSSAVAEVEAQADRRVSELTRQLEDQNRKADALQRELAKANERLNRRRDALDTAKRELVQARNDLAEAGHTTGTPEDRERIAKLERDLVEREKRITRQQQEIALLEAETDVQRAQLNASLRTAEIQDAQLRDELVRQTEANAAARAELAMTEQALVGTRQELAEAETRIAENERALEAERQTLAAERENLESQRQASAADQDRLIGDMATELQERSRVMTEQQAVIEQLEREAEELRENLASLDRTRQQKIAMRTAQPAVAAAEPARPVMEMPRDMRLGRFHALIIGNSNYEHLPDLETAKNDAVAIEKLLREKYGFQTTLLTNADRVGMFSALYNLRANMGPNDNLLIYYAGHGEIDRANRQSYWLPVNAESQGFDRISNQQITEQINLMKARHVIVVADSCYSGAMTRPMVSLRHGDPVKRLRYLAQLPSRTVLTSGGEVPVLDGGGGGHSVFAKSFIRILSDNEGVLMSETLHAELLERVRFDASRFNVDQHPEFSELADAGHENGQFLFVPSI